MGFSMEEVDAINSQIFGSIQKVVKQVECCMFCLIIPCTMCCAYCFYVNKEKELKTKLAVACHEVTYMNPKTIDRQVQVRPGALWIEYV